MATCAVQDPLLDLDAVRLPLSAVGVFGREAPFEVEIGSGKGRFLVAWATCEPSRCFLGVERAAKYLAIAVRRAARAGLPNVRFVRTTAEDLVFRCLAPHTLAGLHVYFPDPWPKKRHHKRRFFNEANVQRLVDVLAPGALLRVKTDHVDYGDRIAGLLDGCTLLAPVPADEAFAGLPETSFEAKYAREGRLVVRLAYRRLP